MSRRRPFMSLKPYFQLVRLPNVFTAAADSLAGWLLVHGSLHEPRRWLPLVGASMAIYAAGIALNDTFDYEIDLVERPNRPLPSGRVSRRFAAWLGGTLLALGPLLTVVTGSWTSVAVALALAACVLGYDAGLKRSVLGPEFMGACRGLNVLLGMSQASEMGGPCAWLVAVSLAVFVTGVTWISRSETRTGRSTGLPAGIGLQNVGLLGLIAVAIHPWSFPTPVEGGWLRTILGLVVLLVVGVVVNASNREALREPVPMRLQTAVKTGVLSLVWLNVGVVAAVRGVEPAFVVAVLWVPAFTLGRWIYST